MKLSNRLNAIASFVKKESKVADIGTDHGYIPVWLLLNEVTNEIIATDIHEGPLKRARITAKEYGFSGIIDFRLTDGLSGISDNEADTVIIAGMGGENIINIIKASNWNWEKHRLILQPMTKQPELCRFLYNKGFTIVDEMLAEDAGEIYRVVIARAGKSQMPPIPYLSAGEALFKRNDPLLYAYLEILIKKTTAAISGIESGKNIDTDNLNKLKLTLAGFLDMKGRL